jgi:methylated-DNA-[protein]-cysteine S-methyltransferase
MKNVYFYNYKICNLSKLLKLGIAEKDGAICRVCFDSDKIPADFNEKETPLIKRTANQLDEYFNKKRKKFDIQVKFDGTDFQKKVWIALLNIPYGETRSYGEIAAVTGNPKASRAVGMANNRNPVPIIVPCHRVIGHDKSLTGYAGGLDLKKSLLEIESNTVNN